MKAGSTRPNTHTLSFGGDLLRRGFWLYAWEVTAPGRGRVYYVGRTGDSSSSYAQFPFNRMGQHLGFNAGSNMMRKRLRAMGIAPEECRFRLVAHGPVTGEAATDDQHRRARDTVAALEKALADALLAAGYEVINKVCCQKPLDERLFKKVRAAFSSHFKNLSPGWKGR